MRNTLHTVAITAAALALAGTARAAYITNGDFETFDSGATPPFTGWTGNGVTDSPSVIDGSHSAKLANVGVGPHLAQAPDDPSSTLTKFTVGMDLVAADAGSTRSFQVNLYHASSKNINLRIVADNDKSSTDSTTLGDVQVFNGSSWVTALADVINFTATDGSGGFGTSPSINSLSVSGDYSGAAPSYTVTANGSTSGVLSAFQGGAPASGSTLTSVSFQAGSLASGSYFVVDNVSVNAVPEPASMGLMGLGGLLLLRRGRRR